MDANNAGLDMQPGGGLNPDADEFDSALGDELRGLRAKRGLSQEQLAALVGMNKKTIQRLESGERAFDVRQLYRICRALGIKPSVLLDAAESEIGIQ